MRCVRFIYRIFGKPIPYYANYPLRLLIWKPIRKYINVVIIPNIAFARVRVMMYRMLGFRIGKNVFIGMKCYMDDMEPSGTIIEDNVTISYGTYFAVHGKGQGHTSIHIKDGAYIGMRCNILSGKEGITIGRNAVIGAGSLVNKSIPDNALALGHPIKIVRIDDKPRIN
ncbi:MAG: acyltransferase [Phycisphaerae bacterium]|nr:acyltransferase [Phycisphaerae bacterium]